MSAPDQVHGRWLAAMPAVFVLIWSTGFIVARYGMPHAPPLSFLCVRYALSVLCFGAWVAVAGVPLPRSRAQWGHLAVTGVLMHAGYLGGVWAAVKAGMGSGLSSLIVGLQPVLTAAWMSWHGSRVSRWQWLGLLLGCDGLVQHHDRHPLPEASRDPLRCAQRQRRAVGVRPAGHSAPGLAGARGHRLDT